MNQKTTRRIAKIIAIALVGALVITSFSFVFTWAGGSSQVYGASYQEPDWNKELSELRDFILKTKAGYKDEVTYESLIKGAYEGIVDALGDPYSVYYGSESESNQFEESVSGEFYGIGVQLEQVSGVSKVVAPIPGTPAEKAGMLSGDIITKVDGKDVSAMSLNAIVNLLKGKSATKVSVTVQRGNISLTFSMVREKIKLTSVNYKLLSGDIGYIQITQFDSDSHLEFKDAKLKLMAEGAKSFIVDVRNNPGGYVGTAADISQQFMPKGPIVHFENQGKILETISADGRGDLKMPVVVLINEGSASASEILAAAWQDSGTAKLVGTRTYGKGVAQQMMTTATGGKIKLSTYYFLSPNKKVIDKVGVTPDYTVKNYGATEEGMKIYEKYKDFAPMAEKTKPVKGDTGLNIFGAQQRLSLLGYNVVISGTLDDKTFEAIKLFQKEKGLYSYGGLDYSTMAMIDKATLEYASGEARGKDLQLEKAIELLK
jgi:carboxyl-terminal processing protease